MKYILYVLWMDIRNMENGRYEQTFIRGITSNSEVASSRCYPPGPCQDYWMSEEPVETPLTPEYVYALGQKEGEIFTLSKLTIDEKEAFAWPGHMEKHYVS